MKVIGLTGSIGMGKSTAAAQLEAMGGKICNADAVVHALMARGGEAVSAIGSLFPHAVRDGAVDRKILGDVVFGNPDKLKQLEHIIHPLVTAHENAFIARERAQQARFVVLEIPLLFETGSEKRCDAVIVVTAPRCVQRTRVMQRPGMTKETFARILSLQMPDREKRQRADFVVQTGFGKAYSRYQLKRIVRKVVV